MEDQNQGGRPTKYRKIFEKVAYQIALLGGTDKMLAEALGVNIDTIHDWKKKHRGFSDSLRRGKIPADGNVAQSFYRRAVGFLYSEVTYEKTGTLDSLEKEDDSEMMTELYRKKIVRKLALPDTGAGIKWLSNRQKLIWSDRQTIDFEKLTQEDLDYLVDQLKKASNE